MKSPVYGRLSAIPDEFFSRPFLISRATIALFAILTLLQLAALIILHVLTIVFRSYRSVKASSFKLNQVVFVGCYSFVFTILVFLVIDLNTLDNLSTMILCNMGWVWLLSITSTLMFGM